MTFTVETKVRASVEKCWQIWISKTDILQFNNPFPDWHTGKVEIDFKEGGKCYYRMESLDKTAGFDFSAEYIKIVPFSSIEIKGDDGRTTLNTFEFKDGYTTIRETVQPDEETPLDLQKQFVQGILDSFKKYVENF